MRYLFLLIFFISTYSQTSKISGYVKDNNNRGIQSASVVVFDYGQNILKYAFTQNDGSFVLEFQRPENDYIKIVVSSLGYTNTQQILDLSKDYSLFNFVLVENIKTLNEVIIESDQKIKINIDTTTIKVEKFINGTEQTVDDLLKKIPGIEVLNDGTIKAHGVFIDKLLVEGDDVFDKNYRLLSKNLDANVLEAVQIIDRFDDNPIFKKTFNSSKVALNLRLKKNKKNVWFGNVVLGSGVISENRWKEGMNLGLLRKKIKLFYLLDYNNSGEKSTEQVVNAINENNDFGEDRYEKTSKNVFNIASRENTTFSKSQSVINKAFLNTLSFTTKFNSKIKLRAVGYYATDNQNQLSFSNIQYNLISNPVSFNEVNDFYSKKTLSSGEIELKYYLNNNNYLSNVFIFKNDPKEVGSKMFFNSDEINQSLDYKRMTFYNHFNHTYSLAKNKILNNYFYFGSDFNTEKIAIQSGFLNDFLNENSQSTINQRNNNSILYCGFKSKIISKFKRIEHIVGFQIETNKEEMDSEFQINSINASDYQNNTILNQNKILIENLFKYNLTEKINIISGLTSNFVNFKNNNKANNISTINPRISLLIRQKHFGVFNLSYVENSDLPEINMLINNNQLTDYRSFYKSAGYERPLKRTELSFSHKLFNDVKRFSLNTTFDYSKSKFNYSTESIITNSLVFSNYRLIGGGEKYSCNFNIVNYLKKIKVTTKAETIQNWATTPVKVNDSKFIMLKSYSDEYKFSFRTHFNIPVNINLGLGYNCNQTNYNQMIVKNITKNGFLNFNYEITKTWSGDLNSSFHKLSNKDYFFVNAKMNYMPENSRFSYYMIFNNLTNQNKFTLIALDGYTSYQSSIDLTPRYVLIVVKYRF